MRDLTFRFIARSLRYLLTRKADPYATDDPFVGLPQPGSNQRRAFIRLDLLTLLHYRVLPDPASTGTKMAMCSNISGGGLMFVSDSPVAEGARVEVRGKFFGRELTLEGRVARVYSHGEQPKIHEVAVTFTSLSIEDHEFLVREIFQRIRDLGQFTPSAPRPVPKP